VESFFSLQFELDFDDRRVKVDSPATAKRLLLIEGYYNREPPPFNDQFTIAPIDYEQQFQSLPTLVSVKLLERCPRNRGNSLIYGSMNSRARNPAC